MLGTDLSPVQPSCVPVNCAFEVDDVESDWVFRRKFDFIHARLLVLSVRDWPKVFQQTFAQLRPGGWAEFQEATFVVNCDDESGRERAFPTWLEKVGAAALKIGVDVRKPAEFGPMLESAGFVNCHTVPKRWPIGRWPSAKKGKMLGAMGRINVLNALHGVGMGFLGRIEGWTPQEVEMSLIDIRKEINSPNSRFYIQM